MKTALLLLKTGNLLSGARIARTTKMDFATIQTHMMMKKQGEILRLIGSALMEKGGDM